MSYAPGVVGKSAESVEPSDGDPAQRVEFVDLAHLPAAVAPSMADEFPEVENFTRVSNPTGGYLSYREQKIQVKNLTFTDSAFFKVFSFRLLSGNPEKVLSQPYQAVLSKSTAAKLFGKEDPVGNMIRLNGEDNLVVTGVVDDFPGIFQVFDN